MEDLFMEEFIGKNIAYDISVNGVLVSAGKMKVSSVYEYMLLGEDDNEIHIPQDYNKRDCDGVCEYFDNEELVIIGIEVL